MLRHLMILTTLSLLFGTAALAVDPSAIVNEWGVETDTFVTSLPETVPSSMTARNCPECKGVDLSVTKESQFFIGDSQVSLAELRRAAQTKHFMMVHYKPQTNNVSRIIIFGISPAK